VNVRVDDPDAARVAAAEDAALPDGGRGFRRWEELEQWVRSVLSDPWWEQTFPQAPVEVDLQRRSRGATFSAAHVLDDASAAVIWIRDGSWDAVTVVHELAHVAARSGPGRGADPHGSEFVEALEALWRRYLGLQAWAAFVQALDPRDPDRQRGRRRSDPGR
jgi:putative metallohydrolase (TIGR04338 family)